METYQKIQTIFKRDPATRFKNLLLGDFSIPEFEYLQNNIWVYYEKVDGTNTRVLFKESIEFRGKTDESQLHMKLVKRLQERFLPQQKTFQDSFSDGVCLYGEGYGPKIQKGGGNYRDDQDFVLFDVKIGDWWLQRDDVEEIAQKLGLDVVPIIGQGTLNELIDIVKPGFNSTWGDFIAEGVVAKPLTELKTRAGERVITKLKYKDFQVTK